MDEHAFCDAAKSYEFAQVKSMLEANPALINVQPGQRWSALHQFAKAGHPEAVEYLLKRGADTAAKTKDGQTPRDVAHPSVQGLLDAHGASVGMIDGLAVAVNPEIATQAEIDDAVDADSDGVVGGEDDLVTMRRKMMSNFRHDGGGGGDGGGNGGGGGGNGGGGSGGGGSGAGDPSAGPLSTTDSKKVLPGTPDVRYKEGRRPPSGEYDDGDPSAALVDINAAGVDQLATLPGIGPRKAAAIVAHRELYGRFASVESLEVVPGIGAATVLKLRPLVQLGHEQLGARPGASASVAPASSSNPAVQTFKSAAPEPPSALAPTESQPEADQALADAMGVPVSQVRDWRAAEAAMMAGVDGGRSAADMQAEEDLGYQSI